ncbi:DIAP2-like protein, partial [Mya arenaria]
MIFTSTLESEEIQTSKDDNVHFLHGQPENASATCSTEGPDSVNSKKDVTTLLEYMRLTLNKYGYLKAKKRKGRRLSQRRQEAQQQAEELPRYPEQCTEGSEIQDRESRNYDIVTSTRPVFSERDSATATNTPIPVTPTLNLPYAQERALLERVQGQGQHGTAGGGGRTTPRHPQYEDQTARQRSFTTWPATAHQAPARQQDLVRCYHCGIGLKDWSDGDEPLFEHIRHSPNCLFLRELLGEQLLNTYR